MRNRIESFLLIISVVLISNHTQCQMKRLVFENSFTTFDTTEYEFTYKLVFVKDTSKAEEKLIDKQILQLGKSYSFYFSELLYINDSINTIREESNAKTLLSEPRGAAEYDVLRNKKTKEFDVSYRQQDAVFHYKENIPTLNWSICDEKKTIQRYVCQRATTRFRGRDYEAWFSFEIPISEGPYKFGGLPGMILEIKDSRNHFVYTCIEIKKIKKPIKIRNWNYTKISRLQLHSFLKKKYKDLSGYNKARGVNTFIVKDSKIIEAPANFKVPYNPIELE